MTARALPLAPPAFRRSRQQVVQDIIMPIEELKAGVELFHREFDIYPLLVFPIRIYDHGKHQGFLRAPAHKDGVDGPDGQHPGKAWGMYVDLGAYGTPQRVRDKQLWDFRPALLAIEEWARKVGGYQCVYADMLQTRTEYRDMFDHALYDKVRRLRAAEREALRAGCGPQPPCATPPRASEAHALSLVPPLSALVPHPPNRRASARERRRPSQRCTTRCGRSSPSAAPARTPSRSAAEAHAISRRARPFDRDPHSMRDLRLH